jgi:hypothetical protein
MQPSEFDRLQVLLPDDVRMLRARAEAFPAISSPSVLPEMQGGSLQAVLSVGRVLLSSPVLSLHSQAMCLVELLSPGSVWEMLRVLQRWAVLHSAPVHLLHVPGV